MDVVAVTVAVALGLAPPHTSVSARTVAARTGGSYLLVLWSRPREREPRSGMLVWRLTSHRRHLLFRHRFAPDTYPYIRTGELTRDGVPELLLAEPNSGTGNCGVRRVLDLRGTRRRELWRRVTCDTDVQLSHHRLVVASNDYVLGDPHCCPMFSRRREFVWRRSRFIRAREAIFWNCISCLDERDLPRFRPYREAFWDRRRGIAIARHPWRIGRSVDGGRTWQPMAVARWRLEAPRATGLRGAIVRFRCDRCPLGYRLARTRDFGETWTVSR